MYILLALIIGFSVVIATILNGKLAEKIGVVNDIVINFLIGLLTSTLFLFFVKENIPTLSNLKSVPIYLYFGGLIGLVVLWTSNVIVPKIATAYIVILAFVGQILTSALIDYFFLNLFSKGKIIGGIVILLGLIYNVRIDKIPKKEKKMNSLQKERKTMYHMINIYCREHHGKNLDECAKCKGFWEYANKRLDLCPYGEEKPNCKLCPIHCYKPDQKEYAKEVMKFSGPRMSYRHPILAMQYLRNTKKQALTLPTKKN